jgi:hypothetical protein
MLLPDLAAPSNSLEALLPFRRMRQRVALGWIPALLGMGVLVAGLLAASFVTAASAAPPTVIDSGGIGLFRLGQSLLRAQQVFGPPTTSRNVPATEDSPRCRANWRSLELTIEFTGRCSFTGRSWRVTVTSPGWRTREGLRVGDAQKRITRVHRGARASKGPSASPVVKWGLQPLGVEWNLRRARPSSSVIVATQSGKIVGLELRRV